MTNSKILELIKNLDLKQSSKNSKVTTYTGKLQGTISSLGPNWIPRNELQLRGPTAIWANATNLSIFIHRGERMILLVCETIADFEHELAERVTTYAR